MKSILDKSFQYTPAAQTDLAKTFARVRREQKQQAQMEDSANLDALSAVEKPGSPRTAFALLRGQRK